MANSFDRQIIQEGYRNVTVKFTGYLDSGDAALEPALDLTDCSSNDPRMTLVGFSIGEVQHSISHGLEVGIYWNGTDPQQAFLLEGSGEMGCPVKSGYYAPDRTADGYDGSLLISSFDYEPGSVATFTLILKLKKLYTQ